MLKPMLCVEHLSMSYGAFRALDQVSFHVYKGECLAILGPNGAGKTSLFDALSGFCRPSKGQIWLNGKRIDKISLSQRFHAGLVRCYQHNRLFNHMTVLENMQLAAHGRHSLGYQRYAFWLRMQKVRSVLQVAQHWLKALSLWNSANTLACDLTLTQQKKLALAMALASCAPVMLLDEPTAGLSAKQKDQLITCIEAQRGERTILLIEHDMDVVFKLAQRILVLDQGHVVAFDTPQAIANNPKIQALYLTGHTNMEGQG